MIIYLIWLEGFSMDLIMKYGQIRIDKEFEDEEIGSKPLK